IRVALGATPRAIVSLVQWQSMRAVLVGLGIGLSLVTGLSALLSSWLPRTGLFSGVVRLADIVPYTVTVVTLLAACVSAAIVPARRAARIDPIATLRQD